MQWLEAKPLPDECQNCEADECYNCDYAGKRWCLSQEDELQIRRKGLIQSAEHLCRKLNETKQKPDVP